MQSASSNLQLIKSGAADGGGKVSNVVTSTVGGMVIEVPPKKGTSVTEANNFNPGTTIASVADMNDAGNTVIFDEKGLMSLPGTSREAATIRRAMARATRETLIHRLRNNLYTPLWVQALEAAPPQTNHEGIHAHARAREEA